MPSFLLSTIICDADPVGYDRALKVARNFMRSGLADVSLNTRIYSSNKAVGQNEEQPSIYAFNKKSGGFVLVSGDDSFFPVIGYSDDAVFSADNMPANLAYWLDGVAETISRMSERSVNESVEMKKAWETLEVRGEPLTKASSDEGKMLETALWSQGEPYNNLCPILNGKRCLSGCVATAMAIVMYYHRWPDKGKGVIPAYRSNNMINIDSHALGYAYDWENMSPTYGADYSRESGEAVAVLMRDCGYMVKMDYGLSASGALGTDIVPALVSFMRYDPETKYCSKEDFSMSEWVAMLKANISEGQPIIYTATNGQDRDGHAFVLDGYDDRGWFHINWGWGGTSNGFFLFPDFDQWTKNHHAVLGMRPDPSAMSPVWLTEVDGVKGLVCHDPEFVPGRPFVAHYALEAQSVTDKVDIRAGKYTKTGLMGEWLSDAVTVIFPSEGARVLSGSLKCTALSEIEIGDRVRLFYRGENNWLPVRAASSSVVDEEIPMADLVSIEEATSVGYVVTSKTLIVSTKDGVSFQLRDNAGNILKEGNISGGEAELSLADLMKGSYCLVLEKGREIKKLEIVL